MSLEQSLDQALRRYIQDEHDRLQKLKTFVRLKRQESRKLLSNFEELAGVDPLGEFTTLRRFRRDWTEVDKNLQEREYRQGQIILLIVYNYLTIRQM